MDEANWSHHDPSYVKSDPGYYKSRRPKTKRRADGYRKQPSQRSDSEQELTPRHTPTANSQDDHAPHGSVSRPTTDLNVEQGITNPIRAIEATLDNVDVETQHSDNSGHSAQDRLEVGGGETKVLKFPPLTPKCCVDHSKLCAATYTVIIVFLVGTFIAIAASMIAWGIQSVPQDRVIIQLSTQEISSLYPDNYGQFYSQVCLEWEFSSEVNLFIARAKCSTAFSNESVSHIPPPPISGSLQLSRNYAGLQFYWLPDTTFHLTVEVEPDITTFHLLRDSLLSGGIPLEEQCRDLAEVPNPERLMANTQTVKQSFPLPTNNSEVQCTGPSNGKVSCEIEIPLNEIPSHYYLCFTTTEDQSIVNYELDIDGPTLDFNSFEGITECESSNEEFCNVCIDYEDSVLIELAHPTCIFLKTNATGDIPYNNVYIIENEYIDIKRRLDIFYLLAIALIVIIVVGAISTTMFISVWCKHKNGTLKGFSCRRVCEWNQYGGYERLD